MRNFDLTPLYRSTVGFDRFASMLDQVLTADVAQPSYPPYNIEKTGDDAYRITLAVAGFSMGDLDIEAREGVLIVKGGKAPAEGELEALAGEFANELLNQVLRQRISDSTARIREYYMARAFFSAPAQASIDQLLAELDAEEMEEDDLEIAVPWEDGGA